MNELEFKLNKMKEEIAAEFGIPNYNSLDKGELTARQNGQIGGEMVKRLIEMGKKQLVLESQRELVPIVIKRERKQQRVLALPMGESMYYQDLEDLPPPEYFN